MSKKDFALAIIYITNPGLPNANVNNETFIVKIPDWMKTEAGWWALGRIDDTTLQLVFSILFPQGL